MPSSPPLAAPSQHSSVGRACPHRILDSPSRDALIEDCVVVSLASHTPWRAWKHHDVCSVGPLDVFAKRALLSVQSVLEEPPLIRPTLAHSGLVARLVNHIPQSWLRPSHRTGTRAVPSICPLTQDFITLMPAPPFASSGALCRAHLPRARTFS